MLCVSSMGSWFWFSEHGIRHRCPFLDPYPSTYCPRPWVHKSSHSKEGNVFGYQNILICLQGGDRFTRKLIKPLSFTHTDPFQAPGHVLIFITVFFSLEKPPSCVMSRAAQSLGVPLREGAVVPRLVDWLRVDSSSSRRNWRGQSRKRGLEKQEQDEFSWQPSPDCRLSVLNRNTIESGFLCIMLIFLEVAENCLYTKYVKHFLEKNSKH